MKRTLALWALISVVVVSVGVFSCKKAENLLEANPDESNTAQAGNLPTAESIIPANGDELTNLNGRVEIVFSDFMDPNTIEKANIRILNTATNMDVTDHVVSYDPLHRMAFVRPPQWPDSAAFIIRVTTGAENLAGKPIDGDGDNIEDDSPYDDFLSTFYTGNGLAALGRISPPTIPGHSPGIEGNVARNTQFTVNFANGPMDSATLDTVSFHLTKTATGVAIDIERVGFTANSVTFGLPLPNLLDWGTMYTFSIDGGQVKAFPDTTGEDTYLLILDTDGDGPEENEPDYSWDFVTQDTTGSSQGSPPQVVNVVPDPDHLHIHFGLLPDERMDMTTFTPSNIRAFDNDGYIPAHFHNDLDSLGLRYFYNRATSGTISLFVSMHVQDVDGNLLDGDGDGVGGEPGQDDFWWP